jgi:micrococcal nuclease
MIFFKNQVSECLKKTFISIRLPGVKRQKTGRYFPLILLIFILLTQVSCGLFYAENVNKKNSGEDLSDKQVQLENSDSTTILSADANTQIPSSSETNVFVEDIGGKSGFENYNYTDSNFTVSKVIDGDTIDLKNNMRLRLIGINTPEKNMYFFEEAKVFMEILVLGKQVKLEKDITNKDMYGRYLRYVYLPDIFVNLEIIKSGFANAYTYPPDVKYTDKFIEAERSARANEAGLWQKSPTEVLEVVLKYDSEGKDTENLNGEWVEIKNTGIKSLNLNNWTLKDSGTNIYNFDNCLIEPGKTIFLYSGPGVDTADRLYWNSNMPIWNNEHDTLYIRDSDGLLVFVFNY